MAFRKENVVHEEGIQRYSRFHFRTYTGQRPPHLRLSSLQLYEIYGTHKLADEEAVAIQEPRIRPGVETNHRDEVKEYLRQPLQQFQNDRRPRRSIKLEVRFGKKIWDNPQTFSRGGMTVHELQEVIRFSRSKFINCVRPEGAAGLTEHLTPESSSSPQTGIFTLTINGPGGKTSKLSVSNNERQAVFRYTMLEDRVNMGLLDLICLHRQHDIRFALSRNEQALSENEQALSKESWTEEVRRSIEVSFLRPEVLRFVLNSNRWTVSFIRYKKTDQYHIEGMPQYKVQITKVMEYNVEDTPEDETHEVTVSFERFLTCHTEVKLYNCEWSSVPCTPSDVATILEGLPNFMEKADWINELLGSAQ